MLLRNYPTTGNKSQFLSFLMTIQQTRLSYTGIFIVLLAASLLPPSLAIAQFPEKIAFDKKDSTNGYYLAVRPRSNNIKGTLVLITCFNTAENLLPETRLHNVAWNNDLLTVYLSMGNKLYADAGAIDRINTVTNHLAATFSIDTARVVLGGYDFAGNIALRYTELANETPAKYNLHPKAVFAVDAPVDLFGLWQWCERQVRRNSRAAGDANYILDFMTKDKGKITDNLAVWRSLTPFQKDANTHAGNEQYLVNTPLRLYYDTDIEWQLAEMRNSLYDTNIPDGSELISRLLLQGNNQAAFVTAKKSGRKSNGQRTTNSLSIVDEVDCIHWIKKVLDIFDPVTWQAPYKLPVPAGWTTEHFALPPDFAPTFTWKGVEDIRFHPGWSDTASKGYWAYSYLWWLDGTVEVNESVLKHNLEAYYSGLVGRNIVNRKIPAAKVITTTVTIKKAKTIKGDKETFTGSIRMLDYMTQRPMLLNCIVHVKDKYSKGKTAVLVAVSPQPVQHPLWNEFDSLSEGVVIP